MTFDPSKVPGGDVARWGEDCRANALAGLDAEDWRSIYDWTKSWIGWGGGAWIPDTWLLYAVSSVLRGQPRIAVHSLDLGLKTWLEGTADRAVLTWCRGNLVLNRLADPKTALLDLEDGEELLPPWLRPGADERLAICSDAAAKSRKRVPAVKARPSFSGFDHMLDEVAPAVARRKDGDQPAVWARVEPYLTE